jgi:hypothetical protein
MLSFILLNVCWLSFKMIYKVKSIILSVIMLTVIMLCVSMLCVSMLSVIMLSVIMLSAIMLIVIMLSVIMLSVYCVVYAECQIQPYCTHCQYVERHYVECRLG